MRRDAKYLVVALSALVLQATTAAAQPPLMYEPGVDQQAFLPVSYQCPPKNNGMFELVKMSAVGARVRIRVTFDGERPTHASVQRAWRGKPFENWHEFANPGKRADTEAERGILQTIFSDIEGVRMAICMGVPAVREKYDKILEHNRQHLRPPASD